jgi:hypothetical protein
MRNVILPAARFLQPAQRVTIYPNLVTERRFWLQLYSIERAVMTIYFYTLHGTLLFKTIVAHKEHWSTHTVWLPSIVTSGVYKVAISCGELHYAKTLVIGNTMC